MTRKKKDKHTILPVTQIAPFFFPQEVSELMRRLNTSVLISCILRPRPRSRQNSPTTAYDFHSTTQPASCHHLSVDGGTIGLPAGEPLPGQSLS